MTKELKVGLAAIGAVVGLMGWSVAGGIANRPAITRGAAPETPAVVLHSTSPESGTTAPVAAAAPEPASKAPCCKEGAKHGEHHADCKMKAAPVAAPTPAGDASKCPYLKGQVASKAGSVERRK